MSTENEKLFEEFVEYCCKLTDEHPEVITFLRGRFSKADATYLSSVEFRNTLGRCLSRVQNKQTKVYVYINELVTVLKAHTEKKKVSLQTQAAAPQHDQVETEKSKEDTEEEVSEKKTGSKRQIRHLEKLLRLYSQEIQKLQERELSLEELDDEDSSYIQESRLKQKIIRIFEKLCELKDCSSFTGRVIEQRIKYQGTRYKELNRRLEKFINKTRDLFPDYSDILQVVQKANERHNLGLTRKHMQSIAQDAFRELGNKLQHRRHLDMVYNFGCHLTDDYKIGSDPAEQDSFLARRLRENRSLAENRLEDVIKKYADLQDEGEEEDWKNKNRDDELPSTSKDVKVSQTSRKTQSSKSGESEEEEEDDDEESEESEVDIEEELKQSQNAVDADEDDEMHAEYLNETDQKMEEIFNPQSSSAGKEEGENEESDNSDEDGNDEGTGKDEDQDSSSGSTSLSPEKEDQKVDTADFVPSSNDAQLITQEDDAEKESDTMTSCVASDETDTGVHTMEHLETSIFEDCVVSEENDTDNSNVPYVEVKMPSCNEQGTSKCTDTTNNLVTGAKSPTIKKKVGKSSRLDKCINKITGSLSHGVFTKTEISPSPDPNREHFQHINNKNPCFVNTPRIKAEGQSSNLKLVCLDTPAKNCDSVRKIAFSHGQSADKNADVVHLDNYKNSTHSNASNGVHRAMVMSSSPTNRLKRKRDINSPTNSVITVKVEELGSQKRKRKSSPAPWTGNGVAMYNREENGKQKLKSAKLSSSFTSYSSPSEHCSDNEHDITLDLLVTCSPQMDTARTTSLNNRTDAATQCDPDEVIVLSD
uniref:Death domain-associated protein 6 n=2 Tax=Pyxicephalus adspersus TaxID=30357 RepID=A0AAV3A190_PYXAD|nr:TPA: hypothetical protein GDO54_017231 [Pyxicephalus adspersus]